MVVETVLDILFECLTHDFSSHLGSKIGYTSVIPIAELG